MQKFRWRSDYLAISLVLEIVKDKNLAKNDFLVKNREWKHKIK